MSRAIQTLVLLTMLASGLGSQIPATATMLESNPSLPISEFAGELVFGRAGVLFDADHDGALWVLGATYKARFFDAGVEFIPFLGSRASRNHPVTLSLEAMRVDGRSMPLKAARPERRDHSIAFDRGPVLELYELERRQVEQKFVLAIRPGPGALDLRVAVATDLRVSERAEDLVLEGPDGGATITKAVAVDATGLSLPLSTTWDGSGYLIEVPAAFLDEATFPVVVDPVLSTFAINVDPDYDVDPDVAYDRTTDRYLVVWERSFSVQDHDILASIRSGNGSPIHTLSVDITSAYWASPRVANNARADQFLVVATRGEPPFVPTSVAIREIWGRHVDPAGLGSMGLQFAISSTSSTADEIGPSVGGDPYEPGPLQPVGFSTYYCVAWTRTLTHSNHDVLYRLIRTSGSSFFKTPILAISTGSSDDLGADVSKANGNDSSIAQDAHWTVVWRRNSGTTGIYATHVDAEGVKDSTNLLVLAGCVAGRVSSPTRDVAGLRYVMITGGLFVSGGGIFGRLLRPGSTFLGPVANIGALEGITGTNAVIDDIDSDGCRFVLAYTTDSNGTFVNSARVATYRPDHPNAAILPVETQQPLDGTTSWKNYVRLTTTGSAGGSLARSMVVWTRFTGPLIGEADIRGSFYSAHPSGTHTIVPTGCGGLDLTVSGEATPGSTATYTLHQPAGQFMLVISTPLTPPAPINASCALGVDLLSLTAPFPIVLQSTSTLVASVPCDFAFLGSTLAIQGADGFGTPQLRVSDTVLTTFLP